MRPLLLSIALCACTNVACTYYDVFLLEARVDADAGNDGFVPPNDSDGDAERFDADDTGVDAKECHLVLPPEAPTDAIVEGNISFVVAVDKVDFGESGGWRGLGYDLDHVCDCSASVRSCAPAVCNPENEIDNAFGNMLAVMKLELGFYSIGSSIWSDTAKAGDWGFMIRVSDYNGQPDDSQVTVEWLLSHPFEVGSDGRIVPQWDGQDEWFVWDSNRFVDDAAFVTGGQLVAHLPRSPFVVVTDIYIDFIEFDLVGSTLTAKVEHSGAGWSLVDGIIAAGMDSDKLLAQVNHIPYVSNGRPMCEHDPETEEPFGLFKSFICGYSDLLSSSGPTTGQCDSISFGIGFAAKPAIIAGQKTPPVTSSPCTGQPSTCIQHP